MKKTKIFLLLIAMLSGGGWSNGAFAGVFAVVGGDGPAVSHGGLGFRCAR